MGKTYIKTNLRIIAFVASLFFSGILQAQNTVSIGTDELKNNAVLWLNGDGSQGLLLPSVANVTDVSNPDAGMVVYQTSSNTVSYFNGTAWVNVGSGGGGSDQTLTYDAGTGQLTISGTGGNTQTLSAGGDITGDLNNIQIASGAIQLADLSSMGAGADQILVYNGTAWEIRNLPSGTFSGVSVDGTTITGDGLNTDLAVGIIGNAQISDLAFSKLTGVPANLDTDATNDITTSDITNVGSGQVITNAERTKLTNITGTNTGDEVLFNATTDGIVPAPGASTGRVLQDDGTWVTVSGSGDMLQATYDANSNNVVDDAESAQSLSGTITTSQITDITSAGSGAIITGAERTNLSNQSGTNTGDEVLFNATTDGIVPAPGASTGRVLQDDGTWVTVSGSGDMLQATYDANSNNVVDDAESAQSLSGTITTAQITDITSVGSGAIITGAERTNLSNQSGTNTGDEVLFNATTDGIVPAPGASTGRVLQDDGTWVTVSGSGDMLQATYDTNSNNVVDDAESAQSLSGTITTVQISDITNVGSGQIITNAERTQIGTNQTNITANTTAIGLKQDALPAGTNGQVLKLSAGNPVWEDEAAGTAPDEVTITASGGTGSQLEVIDGSIDGTKLSTNAVAGGTGGVIQDNSITGADISTSANITAASFSGNGSALTNINATQIDGQTVTAATPTTNYILR
ncbi:MAG: hypothetical protein RLO81_13785, partial [Fulvivirga sp.]|uniref:beta strand repeat-containing protein n=1 Tax=Fulvivirga sp. TaxID=1931237 RepID=UPI0032ED4666